MNLLLQPASCLSSWRISLSICREIFFFSSTFKQQPGVSQERMIPMIQFSISLEFYKIVIVTSLALDVEWQKRS